MNTTRSRWAAIGAAVAVTLGAGGIGIANATTDSSEGPVSAFFPIEPCRLADTRPAPNTVGPRTSPIGPGETETFSGWGTAGNCTLPSGTSGLSLNVTAVGATAQTNLRFFPADSDVPTAANLNPTPAAAPTPNAVNVALDGTGEFSVFNAFGSVAVIVDVVGYYDDHTHDDRYYTEAEADDRFVEQSDLVVAPTITRLEYSGQVSATGANTSTKLRDIGTFTSNGGIVRMTWRSPVSVSGGTVCNFGLRVDGAGAGTASFDGLVPTDASARPASGAIDVTIVEVFEGLSAGSHDLDLYVRGVNDPTCTENFGGYTLTVIIEEYPT